MRPSRAGLSVSNSDGEVELCFHLVVQRLVEGPSLLFFSFLLATRQASAATNSWSHRTQPEYTGKRQRHVRNTVSVVAAASFPGHPDCN